VADFGDVHVTLPVGDYSNLKLLKPNQVEVLCKALAKNVKATVTAGYLPFIVGGDCSVLMGVVEGLRSLNQRIGVVYMDAHGDSNTPETTPSGIIGGMDVAITTGRGPEKLTGMFGHSPLLPEENVVLYGVRDLDPLEAKALAESKVKVITRERIRLESAEEAAKQVVSYLGSKCDCVYLHVDLDVFDPSVISAAGLPVPDGLLKNEFLSITRALAGSGKLCCVALMSFDAAKDIDGSQARKVVELVGEAFRA
jgi:arginase